MIPKQFPALAVNPAVAKAAVKNSRAGGTHPERSSQEETVGKWRKETDMTVRELKEGDSGLILNLVKECGPYVAPYNVYAYWILENYYSSTCKVIEEGNRVVGFTSGMPSIDKSVLFIWQICVHKDYRGKGAAVLLLDSLCKSAKELGFEKIELSISENNNASINLFKGYSQKNNLTMIEKNKCMFGDVIEIVYEISLV